ncbi:hypothetical protein HHI36_012497 [Cryptolaemus montrouzieri]|uniref:RING-type domain-containing protein n=1 Tax=Cryptolaemus montrouzieri TaxID=559131 RepID=A0ABD2NEE3_9CUCU
MDVRTVSVVAVVVGTAVFALYEFFFKNEGNRQRQHQYSYEGHNNHGTGRPYKANLSRNDEVKERKNCMKRKDDNCAICLDSLLKGVVIGTICDHQFHYKCLTNWLGEMKVCPICRSPISLQDSG